MKNEILNNEKVKGDVWRIEPTKTKYNKFWTFIKTDCFNDVTWENIINFSDYDESTLSQLTNCIFIWNYKWKLLLLKKWKDNIQIINEKKINNYDIVKLLSYEDLWDFIIVDKLEIVTKFETTSTKWVYRELLMWIIEWDDKLKLDIFNDTINSIRSIVTDYGFKETNFYNLQKYFQWWNPKWWIKTINDEFLKLTSELDLKILIAGWDEKVFTLSNSHRNLESTNRYLKEFHELELLQSNIEFKEIERLFFKIIYKSINELRKKYNLNNINKLLNAIEKKNIIEISLDDYKNITNFDDNYIYCVPSLPRWVSPLNKVIQNEQVNSKLYFYKGFTLWNCNEAETNMDNFTKSLNEQKQEVDKNDQKYYMENIYKEILSVWLPPSCWLAMGIELLVKLILWEEDIRKVNPFINL